MISFCVTMGIVFPYLVFVMVSTIVLTEATKILIAVLCVNFNFSVQMEDVQIWKMSATGKMTAKITAMKPKSALVSHFNSLR